MGLFTSSPLFSLIRFFLLACLLQAPVLMLQVPVPSAASPMPADWLFAGLGLIGISGPVWNYSLSVISIFFAAVWLNGILIHHKLYPRFYTGSLGLFLLLTSFHWSVAGLSSLTFCLFFQIALLQKILAFNKKEPAFSEAWDAGFLAALCSFFFLPSVLYGFLVLLGLFFIRPFLWREWVVSLLGFFTPYFLLFTGFYVWGDLALFSNHLKMGLTDFTEIRNWQWTLAVPLASLLLISLWAFVSVTFVLNRTTIQIRQIFSVLLWFSLIGVLSLLLKPEMSPRNLVAIAVPLAALISIRLGNLERPFFSQVVVSALILLVLFIQYFHFFMQ